MRIFLAFPEFEPTGVRQPYRTFCVWPIDQRENRFGEPLLAALDVIAGCFLQRSELFEAQLFERDVVHLPLSKGGLGEGAALWLGKLGLGFRQQFRELVG